MHDWNHNGRTDPQDRFVDYQVYNEVMNGEHEERHSKARQGQESSIGCMTVFLISLAIGLILILCH